MIIEPSITCGRCAATAPLDQWKGPAGAELPPNRFQCPRCSWAFERRVVFRSGLNVIRCIAVPPELPLGGVAEALAHRFRPLERKSV